MILLFVFGLKRLEEFFNWLVQVNWYYHVRTGFLPFYSAMAFSVVLLFFWRDLKWWQRILISLGVVFSHNYGLWLLILTLSLIFGEGLFKLPKGLFSSLLVGFGIILKIFPDRLLALEFVLVSIVLGKLALEFLNKLLLKIYFKEGVVV